LYHFFLNQEELKYVKMRKEDLNKHRQVKGVDSNKHDWDRIKETIMENKFTLCHLGESVMELHGKYPNDADFGKQVRQLILLKE
jgi:hypothetical protein